MVVKMTDEFTEYLKNLLPQIGVAKVTQDDALVIHMRLVEDIKKMEAARGGFIHEFVTMDNKGRVVIPENLRAAIGATKNTRFDAHLFPSIEKPRGIALIKER